MRRKGRTVPTFHLIRLDAFAGNSSAFPKQKASVKDVLRRLLYGETDDYGSPHALAETFREQGRPCFYSAIISFSRESPLMALYSSSPSRPQAMISPMPTVTTSMIHRLLVAKVLPKTATSSTP